MADRDSKGRFTKGNKWASAGGKARARALTPQRRSEIAALGFQAMADKWFDGDRERAKKWLTDMGKWVQDEPARTQHYWYQFPHPGPHPAHQEPAPQYEEIEF